MRHKRQAKRKRTALWPPGKPPSEEIAIRATYVGSAEHKSSPSPAGAPKLRHNDASRCDPKYKTFEEPTAALRQAIAARQTADFTGDFPKYVWGVLDGTVYEARLVNAEVGSYKAYPLSGVEELPDDPVGVLVRLK